MSLRLTLAADQSPCGVYKATELGPDYEYSYNAETNTYEVRVANYKTYDISNYRELDVSNSVIFSCSLTKANGPMITYEGPEARYWKIQRGVYRLIGDVFRIIETTLYHDDDICASSSSMNYNLTHNMEMAAGQYLHFEQLSANERLGEILNQCNKNEIACELRLRLKNGTCCVVSSHVR